MKNLTRGNEPYDNEPYNNEMEGLHSDLEDIYRIPVPVLNFDPASGSVKAQAPAPRRWRPALVGAAAAAGLALFLVGPSLMGGSPQPVSAEEVLQRTQAMAATNSTAGSFSYYMLAKNEVSGPPGMEAATSSSTTETWFQDATHQRSETYDESGNLVFGQAQNGDDLWFYSGTDELSTGENGELRVVRASQATMAFSTVGPQDFGATSLSGLLEMYSSQCTSAESIGEETVAGRPAYVIELRQTPESCELKPVVVQDGDITSVMVQASEGQGVGVAAGSIHVSGEGIGSGGSGGEPTMEFRILETTTRIWVDQETFITLKMVTESEDGPLASYEVIEFEVNPDFDPSVFAYEAPEGVSVVEATGPIAIKIALSGGSVTKTDGSFEAPELVTPE